MHDIYEMMFTFGLCLMFVCWHIHARLVLPNEWYTLFAIDAIWNLCSFRGNVRLLPFKDYRRNHRTGLDRYDNVNSLELKTVGVMAIKSGFCSRNPFN